MRNDLVLIGGGGHAFSLADSINSVGEYTIIGYTDNEPTPGFPYCFLGNDEVLPQLFKKGIHNAAIAVGFLGHGNTRDRLYDFVKKIGFILPPIIDKSAVVSQMTEIGEGTFVGKATIINAGTNVGKMCIVNTGVILEHQNVIKDFTHIACGATLCGNVTVGEHCFIGANTTVIQGVDIGKNTIIGAASIITKAVGDSKIIIQRRQTEEAAK